MKKALPLVLSIIMLTACTPAPPPSPPEPTPTPLLEVQMQWETPDEGFSAIPAGEEPHYFYDKPLDEFMPSEEYGRIYPYLGSGEMVEWGAVYQYGLCTEKGEIITAPIYSAPILLGFGEERAYLLYTGTGAEIERSEAWGSRMYSPIIGVLVGLDGSWVVEFDDVHRMPSYTEIGFELNAPVLAVQRDGLWGGISTVDGSVAEPFRHERGEAIYEVLYDWYEGFNDLMRPINFERQVNQLHREDELLRLVDENGEMLAPLKGYVFTWSNDFFLCREMKEGSTEIFYIYDYQGTLLGQKEQEKQADTSFLDIRLSGDYIWMLERDGMEVYDRYFNLISRFTPNGTWRYYGYFLADHANQSVQFHSEAVYISDANTGLHRTYRPDGTLLTTCYFGSE